MTTTAKQPDLRSIAAQFQLLGDFVQAETYGNGHINDTYAVVYDQGGTRVRYILQRINSNVFQQPAWVMENIERVTAHLHQKMAEAKAGSMSRRLLTLIKTRSERGWYQDEEGRCWRCYIFVEQAVSHNRIETSSQAFEAAKAFGEFQCLLADLPSPRLHETVPHFHDTRSRFNAFVAAVNQDACNRASGARREIDFALRQEFLADTLLNSHRQGLLPERVTHNDAKLNNVLMDESTGTAACVIDLDTVMPGLALYDFGDLCRTLTCSAAEDERDLSQVELRMDFFKALVTGYLSTAGSFLTPAEKDHLLISGSVITFEIGIRFLADYLQGDCYFKVHRPGHNLDRARVQFKLLDCFHRHAESMREVITTALAAFQRG